MAAPVKLRIPCDEYHFEYVGKINDGRQFMGYLTYATDYVSKFYWTEQQDSRDGDVIWKQHANCFAVLHLFDSDGNHLDTLIERVGGTVESTDRDWQEFDMMIAVLGVCERCDIYIRPFSLEVNGVVHGLIYESEPSEDGELSEWVMLEPRDIMFHQPWDSGEYST